MTQMMYSSTGKENSPLAPTTFPDGVMEHIKRKARSEMPRPKEIVHFLPILSAMIPAMAKPTTEAAPPIIVRIMVAEDTLLR